MSTWFYVGFIDDDFVFFDGFLKVKIPIETPPVVTKISQLCKALSRVEKVAFHHLLKEENPCIAI